MATTIPPIVTLLRSRTTLIWITTKEELRAQRACAEKAGQAGWQTVLWDVERGLTDLQGNPYGLGDRAADPRQAFNACRNDARRGIWIFRDLDKVLGLGPVPPRALKNLAMDLQSVDAGAERCVIVISAEAPAPPDLQGLAYSIEWPLPDRDEIGRILDASVEGTAASLRVAAQGEGDRAAKAAKLLASLEASIGNGGRETAIDAAVGLTAEEAAGCFARSLVENYSIDSASIRTDKANVISGIQGLEWIDPNPGGLDAVGGLEALKQWLVDLRPSFSEEARKFGLRPPKGVLLTGQPGCGKSYTAKSLATGWGMPLLRLDLGAVKSEFVGASERNIRRALQTAESVAPCVLWLDEIEKAMAGATGAQGDGGVSSDALGAVLTWLQDKAGKVFVVATANDVDSLPPELLRKGRFDEIFFVDLPSHVERAGIAAATIKARGRDPKTFDLEAIAYATEQFSGAEVAETFEVALRRAFAEGAREPTTADLCEAAASFVPAARTSGESIQARRDWAKGRARSASDSASTTTSNTAAVGRAVDLSGIGE